MEIRAATIAFPKRKALQQRDEEKKLTQLFNELQEKLDHTSVKRQRRKWIV